MIEPRRLRAPHEDGALLAEPPLEQVGQALAENRRRLRSGPDILGRPWAELRRLAGQETLAAARAYFEWAGDPFPHFQADSLVLAGHQPELVHPGVWVKNFALNGLAAAHGVTPVNLIVDYDTVKATALRLPAITGTDPLRAHVAALPFDHWAGEVPYEERHVRDPALFADLPARAEAIWRGWGFRPLLPEFWDEVLRRAARTTLLGECLAGARRKFEFRWGCHNWEVPVSALCRSEAFTWFACHVLADLPRFHRVYNDAVHEYRRAHGIRSRHHPVPDLASDGDWREAPFWAAVPGAVRRGRLFARLTDSGIDLRQDGVPWATLPLSPRGLRPAWQALEGTGFEVRPRALTNTLFARLFVADLFVHGIGGGTYDELTDEIVRRFYGVEPPRFLVLSGTLRLPLPTSPATLEKRRELIRRLRSLRHNPQRHLPEGAAADGEVRKLLGEREQWLHAPTATRWERRARFAALRQRTERLRAFVAGEEEDVRRELERYEQELDANALLRRRDYAACLYPEELLRTFCTRLLRPVAPPPSG